MDAVKMSLDRKGYLDLKLVSLLLDKTEDETIAALLYLTKAGTAIITDLSNKNQNILEVIVVMYGRKIPDKLNVKVFLEKVEKLGLRSFLEKSL